MVDERELKYRADRIGRLLGMPPRDHSMETREKYRGVDQEIAEAIRAAVEEEREAIAEWHDEQAKEAGEAAMRQLGSAQAPGLRSAAETHKFSAAAIRSRP